MKLGIYMQPGMRMQSRDALDANGGPATSAGRQCGKRESRNLRNCAGSTKKKKPRPTCCGKGCERQATGTDRPWGDL